MALLYVEVGWCGGSVENVLGAGVDLGAGRSKAEVGGSESARLLQPWQPELVTLCSCRSPPSPASIADAGGPMVCSNALPGLNYPCLKASMTIVGD